MRLKFKQIGTTRNVTFKGHASTVTYQSQRQYNCQSCMTLLRRVSMVYVET